MTTAKKARILNSRAGMLDVITHFTVRVNYTILASVFGLRARPEVRSSRTTLNQLCTVGGSSEFCFPVHERP